MLTPQSHPTLRSMIAATGHSEELNSQDAIAEALSQCADTFGGKTPQAGFLYAGIDHDHQVLLDGVEEKYPGIQLIGSTTHGELSSTGFLEDSVVLMLMHADGVTFSAVVEEGVAGNTEDAAQQAAAGALQKLNEPARLCIAISDPFGVDSTALIGKLVEVLGQDVPVCGGLAGEPLRWEQTYQFCNGKVFKDAVVLLVLAGPLRVSTGVASGWESMGGDHRITDAEGLTIMAIDDEPVKDVWLRYFGSDVVSGTRHMLAVYAEPDDVGSGSNGSGVYLSAPLDWNDDGSMVVSPAIPTGSRFRFADATREQILSGAESSVVQAVKDFEGTVPDAGLFFSCAARHASLGTRVEKEYAVLREQLGEMVPMIGFYTYGEFCPLSGSVISRAHGATFVSVLIAEHS